MDVSKQLDKIEKCFYAIYQGDSLINLHSLKLAFLNLKIVRTIPEPSLDWTGFSNL